MRKNWSSSNIYVFSVRYLDQIFKVSLSVLTGISSSFFLKHTQTGIKVR